MEVQDDPQLRILSGSEKSCCRFDLKRRHDRNLLQESAAQIWQSKTETLDQYNCFYKLNRKPKDEVRSARSFDPCLALSPHAREEHPNRDKRGEFDMRTTPRNRGSTRK